MERISILLSILAIGYLSRTLFKEKSRAFIFTAALVLFASTAVLSGFVSGSLSGGVNGYVVFFGAMVFLILGKIIVIYDGKNKLVQDAASLSSLPSISRVDKKSSWIFVCAFLSWTALTLYMSSWQITPHGVSVDSAAHYSLVRYLYESRHLPSGDWPFLWEIAHYPFGFHLTTAIIANLFGVNPIYVMWIFAALLMGVVVASVCTMIYCDLHVRGSVAVLATLWAFAMFAVSPYVAESYSRSGFYPMVLGLVYIVMFIWCMRCFTEITWGKIFFISIALAGMGLTYPQWLPLLFVMYAYFVYSKGNVSGQNKMVVFLIPTTIASAFGIYFALQNWDGLKYIYNIEGGIVQNPYYLAMLAGGCFFLILLTSYKKLCLDYVFLLLAVVALVCIVAVSKVMAGFGGMYPIYKYAYVLTPLFILFIAQGYFFNRGDGILQGGFKVAIPVVVLLGTFSSFSVHSGFHSGLQNFKGVISPLTTCLTKSEFNVLEWVRNNAASENVTYLGDAPFVLFGYAVTGKTQNKGEFGWWVQPRVPLDAWGAQADSGEIAVLSLTHLQEDIGRYVSGGHFEVLYESEDGVVLKKI